MEKKKEAQRELAKGMDSMDLHLFIYAIERELIARDIIKRDR